MRRYGRDRWREGGGGVEGEGEEVTRKFHSPSLRGKFPRAAGGRRKKKPKESLHAIYTECRIGGEKDIFAGGEGGYLFFYFFF